MENTEICLPVMFLIFMFFVVIPLVMAHSCGICEVDLQVISLTLILILKLKVYVTNTFSLNLKLMKFLG